MKQETIHIAHLTTGYKHRAGYKIVARDIDVSLNSGELTCLLGSNGVGKSTLLRSLSGIQPFIRGNVTVLGKTLSSYTHDELAKEISVVLTDKCHLQNLCVEELVALGRSPYTGFWGNLTAHDREVIEQALVWVGVKRLRQCAVNTLSDGERQKVMIAKALAQETPVMLLDEPTAFLDFPSKIETMQLLRRLAGEMNKTILVTTHDVELALQIADKIWLMDADGKMDVGIPEDLALNHRLANGFERKDIVFDEMTGLFRVHPRVRCSVNLYGTPGVRMAMVRKACCRKGIEVDERIAKCAIKVLDDSFVVEKNGRYFDSSQSIEGLLDMILSD